MLAEGRNVDYGYSKPRAEPPAGSFNTPPVVFVAGEPDDLNEPEPGPSTQAQRRPTPGLRCAASITTQLGREFTAYWQLCQLAADLASMTSPWAAAGPFFVALAERQRVEAGGLIDLLLLQGEVVELPPLEKPLQGLALGFGAGPSLRSALESAIQLLDATDRNGFALAAARDGDAQARHAADDLYLASRKVRATLYTHLTAIEALGEQVGPILQYTQSNMLLR